LVAHKLFQFWIFFFTRLSPGFLQAKSSRTLWNVWVDSSFWLDWRHPRYFIYYFFFLVVE
jgi:hypothetical protein